MSSHSKKILGLIHIFPSLWYFNEVWHCWQHVYNLCTKTGNARASEKHSTSRYFQWEPCGPATATFTAAGDNNHSKLLGWLKSIPAQLFDCHTGAAEPIFQQSHANMNTVNYTTPHQTVGPVVLTIQDNKCHTILSAFVAVPDLAWMPALHHPIRFSQTPSRSLTTVAFWLLASSAEIETDSENVHTILYFEPVRSS